MGKFVGIKKFLRCILYCNIYCYILFPIQNSRCVLSQLNVIALRPKIKSKTIDLCYEIHEKNHRDQFRQYKKIEEVFLELETDFEKKAQYYSKNQTITNFKNYNLEIPVLVEVPIQFNNENKKKEDHDDKNLNSGDDPEVTKDICQRFKYSSVIKPENINSRLASTAINCLLKPEINPNDIPEDYIFRSHNKIFCAKDMKLKDLFDEIKGFKEKSHAITLSFHDNEFGSNISEQFDVLLNRSKESEQILLNDLKSYLKELNYDYETDDIINNSCEKIENINILEFSKKLYELDKNKIKNIEVRRKTLIFGIILTINPHLELNILKRILENKESEKTIVIVGALHSQSIYSALLNLGAQVIEKYGEDSDFSNNYYVLSNNDLDRLKLSKQSNCTLI